MRQKQMDRTTAYAKLIVSGRRLSGRSEYLACKRHLDDMARKDFDYIFDADEAEKHISLANELTIGEGDAPKKLHTRGFQDFIIGSLFGWRKKRSRERRFREAYVQMARQNGKTFLSGTMANDFAAFQPYQYGKILCTATKQDQARLAWDEVRKFVESDKDLAELYRVTDYKSEIHCLVTGSVIKALGRDTKSADGIRSNLAIIDEYHAHKTDQMYKLMLKGQVRVNNALVLAITTAGFDLAGPCYRQYQFCKAILAGAIRKESHFVYIAEMDEDDNPWDFHNWAKANPLNLWKDDTTLHEEMVARYAEEAMTAKEKGGEDMLDFQTKSLNSWVTFAGDGLVNAERWAACGSDLTMADMVGKECYLGIDLSSGGDLTSIDLLFPLDDEKVYLFSHSFMPQHRLLEHEKTDDVPYRVWVNQGLLTLTDGGYGIKTDYKYIVAYLQKLIADYGIKVREVGYDPHNASAFLADLDFLGCNLTEIVQSARSLNDSTVDFRLSVKAGTVLYDKNNALLTWSVLNAILTKNSFGEVKIDKQTQVHRIDPVDACIDAWKLHFMNKSSRYNADEAVTEWEQMMEEHYET